MIGRKIGRYLILEKLGEGGMGSVWKAEDPVLRRTLAIKLLAGTLGDSAEARERFLREARAVSRLDHPGIAAVHDFGEVDGSPFIAFQYVSGKTLGSLLARGPMDPARSCALIAEAADALAHAHARGVVHRDVTANNLMVRDDGRLIVVDFGLALPEGDVRLTRSAMAIGTLGYMAPETYRGEGVSIPSDIYGLGVVLYRMVTGQVPFEAPTFEAMMYRTLNDPVMPPSRVNRALPSALDAVVLRALARDPAQRQSSALELAEELRAVATSSPQAIRRDAASTIVTAAQEIPAPGSGAREPVPHAETADPQGRRAALPAVRLPGPARGVLVTAGVALTLVLSIIGVIAWRSGVLFKGSERVIAVLPPQVSEADEDDLGYVAQILGDDLSQRLALLPGYRVLPWGTTSTATNRQRSLSVIASDLHARFTVAGSLSMRDTMAHVRLSIFDAAQNDTLGGVEFDASPSDLFELESRASLGVAGRLHVALDESARHRLSAPPANDLEAYDLVARGSHALASNDLLTRSQAELFFQRALDRDPHLAAAWIGLGAIATDRHFRGESGGRSNLQVAATDYRTALRYQPQNKRAMLGLVLNCYELGQVQAGLEIADASGSRRSDEFDVLMVHATADMLGGLCERSVEVFDRACSLNPADEGAAWFRIVALNWAGEHDRCIQAAREYLRQHGEDAEVLTWMGASYVAKGNHATARMCFDRAMEVFGGSTNLYVVVYSVGLDLADRDSTRARRTASRWVDDFTQRADRSPDNIRVQEAAMVMAATLGRRDVVRRLTERALALATDPGRIGPPSADMLLSLCLVGEHELAHRVIASWARYPANDLSGYGTGATQTGLGVAFDATADDPREWPDFKAALARFKRSREWLANRYK